MKGLQEKIYQLGDNQVTAAILDNAGVVNWFATDRRLIIRRKTGDEQAFRDVPEADARNFMGHFKRFKLQERRKWSTPDRRILHWFV